jgi:hypothetical protein
LPTPVPDAVATASQAARLGFIRKVYCILSLQLAVTFGIVSIFTFVPDVRFWVLDYKGGNPWFSWTCMGAAFGVFIVLVCCGEMARRHPWNMILLLVFTAFEGLFLGSIAARYACNAPSSELYSCPTSALIANDYSQCTLNRDMCNKADGSIPGGYLVLIAIGATVVLVLSLTLFACQTKFDFTGAAPYIFVVLMLFLVFGMICGIWLWKYWTYNIIWSALGVLLFSFILVMNTQMIVGGKHKRYSYGLDDYVFAALSLYLDIINLFMYILAIVGLSSSGP